VTKRIVILLFLFSPSWATLTIDVNTSTGSTQNISSLTSALFSSSGGNEIFALMESNGSSAIKITSITTSGLTWQFVALSSATSGPSAEIWIASTTAAITSKTAQVNLSATTAGGCGFTVLSFTGADLTGSNGLGAVGAKGLDSNVSSSHQPSCNVTTTRSGSFVVGSLVDFNAATAYTATAGNTIDHIFLSPTSDTELDVRTTNVVSGLTSTTLNFTNAATTDQTNFVCAEIKASLSSVIPQSEGVLIRGGHVKISGGKIKVQG
jgi:hypothetical protein